MAFGSPSKRRSPDSAGVRNGADAECHGVESVSVGGQHGVGLFGGPAPHPDGAGGAVHREDIGADPQLVPAVHGHRVGSRLQRDQQGVQAPPRVLGQRGLGSPLAEMHDDGLELVPPVGQFVDANPGGRA